MRKPPPGYVALEAAVDLVGGVVAGSNWQQLPDQTDSERRFDAVWSDPAVDRIITMVAEACENGRVEAAYETILGADALDQKVWRMPHWRNFFMSGTIDLDLPLLNDDLTPVRDGRTARCTRQIFVRRDSLERFIEPLAAAAKERDKPPYAVVPTGVQTNRQAALKGKCIAWIKGLPIQPPRRKSDVKAEGIAAIPGLSGRQFDAAWDDAAPAEWKRAGRRSES